MVRATRRFRLGEEGSIATWTAVAAFPLMMAVTFAIDMQGASRQRTQIENAADSAALAAALNGSLTTSQKEDFAKDQFFAAYSGDPETILSITPKAGEARVEVAVEARFPTLMSFYSQMRDHTFKVRRVAESTTEDTICILALNEKAQGAVEFSQDVQFNAPTCSVHTNSRHGQAIVTRSSRTPTAKGFCATGGTTGIFSPPANGECAQVEDPYADMLPPIPNVCEPELRFKRVDLPTPFDDDDDDDDHHHHAAAAHVPAGAGAADAELVPLDAGDSGNVVTNLTTLTPGTYCGGLTLAGRDVRMLPGEYIMLDGPFVVKDGATVDAQDVLISLSGSKSKLKVEDQGAIDITAPKVGPRAGIAIMEDTRNVKGSGKITSTINDGAITMTGTLYLPSHHIEVKGGASNVGAHAPATSFIVDTIWVRGSGTINVSVDAASAGLPAIQPHSDEGARLVH